MRLVSLALAALFMGCGSASAMEPVTLKCTTSTSGFMQAHTSGDIYLFLEPTNYDSLFQYKVLSITDVHKSIVRDMNCVKYACTSSMSDTVYQIANVSKPDMYILITIDRLTGSYHAEEGVGRTDILGIKSWSKMSEDGSCARSDVPKALF